MAVNSSDEENIAGRLERLPYSRFHTKFALMLASGEWAESLMLLGNGAILALVAAFYGITGNLSAFGIPAFFFAGEFIGSILFGRIADTRGRRAVFLVNQLIFGVGMIIAGFMNSWQLIGAFVMIGGIGVGGEFPLVDSYGTEVFVRKTALRPRVSAILPNRIDPINSRAKKKAGTANSDRFPVNP